MMQTLALLRRSHLLLTRRPFSGRQELNKFLAVDRGAARASSGRAMLQKFLNKLKIPKFAGAHASRK